MEIRAASVGESVPRLGFDAVIHSRFDTAVNLRLSDERGLVTLLISDNYELPQGIRITDRQAPIRDLVVGTAARLRANMLAFADAPLVIDLREARPWRCPVRVLAADVDAAEYVSGWMSCWQLLNEQQREKQAEVVAEDLRGGRSATLTGRRLGIKLLEMRAAAACLDDKGCVAAAQHMIGLGGGVTPSGDDVLVGFLAGLWSATARDPRRAAFIERLGAALLPLTAATTDISATYLLHAAQARFSSSLSNLVTATVTGLDVGTAAVEAFRVGHTSGMDAATGLLFGLAAWSPELERFLASQV